MKTQKTKHKHEVNETGLFKRSWSSVWLTVFILTIIAAGLRLYRLGDWSFWVDEIFTLRDSMGEGNWGLYHGMTYPLSYMLISISLQNFGISEWSARIIPAIFGIITPGLIYLFSRKSFGEGTAIIAAGIIVLSPWHLYWSQMARFYTMTLLFTAISLLLLYRALEEDRRWYAAAAGVLMALGALSHYSAFLVLGAIIVYIISIYIFRWQRPAGMNVVNILIFIAPFILGGILVGHKAVSLLSIYAAGHPTGTNITSPVNAAAYMVFSVGYRLGPTIALLSLIGAGIGIARRNRGTLLLICAVVVPSLLLVAAGVMSHAENRYAFVVLPPTALLAGSVIADAVRMTWQRSRLIALALPIAIALPLLQHDASYFSTASNGERWNYRAAAEYVRSHVENGDVVYSPMWLPLAYYLKNTDIEVRDLEINEDKESLHNSHAWLVIEDATRGESATRQLAGWVDDNCSLEAHFSASSPVADYGLSVFRVKAVEVSTDRGE